MITTEQIIGDVIFISFRDSERYIDFGINKNYGHFLVKGYDSFGIWVAHPGITIKHTEDARGKPIPTKKMFTENILMLFVMLNCGWLPWVFTSRYILLHFENLKI